jgi:hypothetical protein
MKKRIKQVFSKRPSAKSLKSLKLPKVRFRRRKEAPESTLEQAIRGIPRITNETVAEHREEVLSSARKYIYPLQHSTHRVVFISSILVAVGLVSFFTYSVLALYKFNATSTFMYRVTQVVPFPVAKTGPSYVSYDDYLFELRHYIHYYQTQQKVDFASDSGKRQLDAFRTRALDEVITNAYVKQLAEKNKVSVSDQEVNDRVTLIQAQNRLGDNQKAFEDVLSEFWGWSLDDFKRELRNQLLAQKVVSALDTATHSKAQSVLTQLQQGQDFAAMAKQYSEDQSTASSGGSYGIDITRTNRDIPVQIVNELFKMQQGQTSGIINTGTTLEIVKVDSVSGNTIKASHIAFSFKDISTYVNPLQTKDKPKKYISL